MWLLTSLLSVLLFGIAAILAIVSMGERISKLQTTALVLFCAAILALRSA